MSSACFAICASQFLSDLRSAACSVGGAAGSTIGKVVDNGIHGKNLGEGLGAAALALSTLSAFARDHALMINASPSLPYWAVWLTRGAVPQRGEKKELVTHALTNARAQPVTLDLIQRGLDWYWDETRILAESQKSQRLDSDGTRWRVELPANGEATITATFETRY